MDRERVKTRCRDSMGRFARREEILQDETSLSAELQRYGRESPFRLRAIADDPDTPAKLKADIERFFFEAVYGKSAAEREGKGAVQTVKFEGVLEEWSR